MLENFITPEYIYFKETAVEYRLWKMNAFKRDVSKISDSLERTYRQTEEVWKLIHLTNDEAVIELLLACV